MKRFYTLLIISDFLILLLLIGCVKEPDLTKEATLAGTVMNQANAAIIHEAYIIHNDTLLAETSADGRYTIPSLDAGNYSLIYSAVNYRDTMVDVVVEAGKINTLDVMLAPDDMKGRVIGEFQDKKIFDANLILKPDMLGWSEKNICDGLSGATIQVKTSAAGAPESQVYIGDSVLGTADEYGQYWFEIQRGTYPLSGLSGGYHDENRIVKIDPDAAVYVNFYLTPQEK